MSESGFEWGRTVDIGVTGTRSGANMAQVQTFAALLRAIRAGTGLEMGMAPRLHHGDCVGFDKQAANLARAGGFLIVGHPPTNPRLRARFPSDWEEEPLPFLERDQAIVDASDLLIAATKEDHETIRSGTWATIRMARKAGLTHIIIYPSGIPVVVA